MKSVSGRLMPYEKFFNERKNRIMAFLKINDDEQIDPSQIQDVSKTANTDVSDTAVSSANESRDSSDSNERGEESNTTNETAEEKEETPEEKSRKIAVESEKKALDRGLQTLEFLFPKAGWDRISTYPDFYPYFVDIFDLRKGIVNIAPTDPLQQIYLLMRIIEELFYGLRSVSFGTIAMPDGGSEDAGEFLSDLIGNWRYFMEIGFEKEILPRMSEYVRLLEGSPDAWNSPYTKKVASDIHWLKRLYFLPFYKFESMGPPPIQKKDITPVYPQIKKLRRYLAAIGAGIELGNRSGGAERNAHCDGINNPWAQYVFQVPNPVSTRIDALLAGKTKSNAALIYFTLAVTTVLDYLVNSEDSWAYSNRAEPLFRSIGGEGVTPLTGIDNPIDADAIFKESLKKRQKG